MNIPVMRMTAKGQLTIPIEIRKALGIREGDYLAVYCRENEICLRKVETIRPLGQDDPIWRLVGTGASGIGDVAENHDLYLAESELEEWKK